MQADFPLPAAGAELYFGSEFNDASHAVSARSDRRAGAVARRRTRAATFHRHQTIMLFPTSISLQAPPRVVVTGAGIVTALGMGWKPNADGFRAGKVAFRPVSQFDVSRQRVKIAAEVDLPSALPPTQLGARPIARLDRAGAMLVLAALEAWRQAGWEPAENLPLVLGTTAGGMLLGETYFRQAVQTTACATAGKPPAPFITSRRSRRGWFSTRSVSAGRSPSFRTPAPPAAMPSAMPGI